MDGQRVRIGLINYAHLITHYSLLILPTAVLAMAVSGSGFGTDYGEILSLATGMFVLYGLFSLPQGWLAQRGGREGWPGGRDERRVRQCRRRSRPGDHRVPAGAWRLALGLHRARRAGGP